MSKRSANIKESFVKKVLLWKNKGLRRKSRRYGSNGGAFYNEDVRYVCGGIGCKVGTVKLPRRMLNRLHSECKTCISLRSVGMGGYFKSFNEDHRGSEVTTELEV